MGMMSGLIYVPLLLLLVAFIFGSVLARRGEKSWRTLLMLAGSITQAVGILVYIAGVMILFTSYSGASSSSPGGVASALEVVMWVASISGLMVLGGMVCFAIGFVAYCARAGAAGKRAEELEMMLGHLQERIAEQDRMQ